MYYLSKSIVMKSITYSVIAGLVLMLASCASPKGQTWVVTKARGNHFQNQHTKRWYKLEKGSEVQVGDSLKVVFNSQTRFVKLGETAEPTAMSNTVTKNR
jgi:hypothetical protein